MVGKLKRATDGPKIDEGPPPWPDFGKLVTFLMDDKRLEIPEVARILGVTPEMVRRYRMGVAMPRQDTMKKLATLLGVTPSELYDAKGERKPPTIGGPVVVDDPDELRLIEAYRGMGSTSQKVLRHRAAELLEQFGKSTKRNPFGAGNQ